MGRGVRVGYRWAREKVLALCKSPPPKNPEDLWEPEQALREKIARNLYHSRENREEEWNQVSGRLRILYLKLVDSVISESTKIE